MNHLGICHGKKVLKEFVKLPLHFRQLDGSAIAMRKIHFAGKIILQCICKCAGTLELFASLKQPFQVILGNLKNNKKM